MRLNHLSEFSLLDILILLVFRSDHSSYTYLEEFPIDLLDTLSEKSGHQAESVIAVVMQYGANFSGKEGSGVIWLISTAGLGFRFGLGLGSQTLWLYSIVH